MRYPPNAFDVVVLRETLMYLEKQAVGSKNVRARTINKLLN